MRRLPPGTSLDVIAEVDKLRYQIARADALLHAADDLLERVGNERQRREHVAHLVDLAKQAIATALAMGADLARQLLKGRSEG
jgi:DNA-binding MarR family transcriptional regulator